ncbi:DnaA N-terminal domain-containing protein [Laceyella tengchongensis]|uniref:DnaA N-terminal domain-containing protein n=1 Tax=Laceyella tengchongensis TaxID=574699 RepID=UPI0012B8CAD2|nr:hypothetical protein [Laceyella tengchongensis]
MDSAILNQLMKAHQQTIQSLKQAIESHECVLQLLQSSQLSQEVAATLETTYEVKNDTTDKVEAATTTPSSPTEQTVSEPLWKKVRELLKKKVVVPDWELFFKDLQFVGIQDNILYLRGPEDDFALEYMKRHYKAVIETEIAKVDPSIKEVQFLLSLES